MNNERMICYILAGLRTLQDRIEMDGVAGAMDCLPHFDDDIEPSIEEIEELCEVLNCGDLDLLRPGVLTLTSGDDQGTDYELAEDAVSCWITVDNISVYIVRTDEGVAVDVFPKGREDEDALAGCWATFDEAEEDDEVPCCPDCANTKIIISDDGSGFLHQCPDCGYNWYPETGEDDHDL